MWENPVIYEQPVNEQVRVCLRLERLFQQTESTLHGQTLWESRATVSSLLDILYVLDRPDLKTKLTKELCRYIASFSKLEQSPNVDNEKLSTLLTELEHANQLLQQLPGKLAQHLRENELLNNIRQYSLNPGGACNFEIPVYQHWLEQDPNDRIHDLKMWLESIKPIKMTIGLLMRLIRESTSHQHMVAQRGFYQTIWDANTACQLVQVLVSRQQTLYPVISVSRHGIFIRFFIPNNASRPIQAVEDVSFKMGSCIL